MVENALSLVLITIVVAIRNRIIKIYQCKRNFTFFSQKSPDFTKKNSRN